MSPEPTAAETIVLIHGFCVTPRSWEQVAGYALDWALRHARRSTPAGSRTSAS